MALSLIAAAAPASPAVPAAAAAVDPPATAAAGFETLIVRVFVNAVARGDVVVLRDAQGTFLVPAAEAARWSVRSDAAPILVAGDAYLRLDDVPGLQTRFDPIDVTLNLQVPASALPGSAIDLGPRRRGDVIRPADTSVFLNYGLNAVGDDSFGNLRYQAATELGARYGNWLFYSTSDYQWGEGTARGFTRLLTNGQYDDRPNLRRLTIGDFFTTGFDLSSSVPMGGLSLTKSYSMDPYFVQYPTAAFRTELAFPSTVQVRIDGNVIAQSQVPPGPLDITNITSVTGAQNISVVIRDPFGREQVLQQPFFFATNIGLAKGLHEYSYNLGALRDNYGVRSNDYGSLAASAFHRYAFTDQITLGLRGQAAKDVYNVGPFGTVQFPRLGVVAGGVSVGGRDGGAGYAASLGYSYTAALFSLNLGARYFSRDFSQLSDLAAIFRQRSAQYASATFYQPGAGSLTATYGAAATYGGPQARTAGVSYTLGVFGGRGLLAVSYLQAMEPVSNYAVSLSFRYFFDPVTSALATLGATRRANSQSLTLERSVPQGEGFGYSITAGNTGGDPGAGAFGRGTAQYNGTHAEVGAEYARSAGNLPGLARAFVAGSIGAVGGSVFLSRPVLDSFALIRIPELPDVPVYANGWYAGRTNAAGEVVASNLSAYYDNFISFGASDVPMDYVFPSSQAVISPPNRSGTLVTFEVRRMRAVVGVLVEQQDGKSAPLEFRELTLTRGTNVIEGFTARRGEFYVEGVEPGEYLLQLTNGTRCTARLRVPDDVGAMTDVGTLTCVPARN